MPTHPFLHDLRQIKCLSVVPTWRIYLSVGGGVDWSCLLKVNIGCIATFFKVSTHSLQLNCSPLPVNISFGLTHSSSYSPELCWNRPWHFLGHATLINVEYTSTRTNKRMHPPFLLDPSPPVHQLVLGQSAWYGPSISQFLHVTCPDIFLNICNYSFPKLSFVSFDWSQCVHSGRGKYCKNLASSDDGIITTSTTQHLLEFFLFINVIPSRICLLSSEIISQ